MSTTTLYAELVVVGTGALVFILLFFYALFGDQTWLSKFHPASIGTGTAIYLVPVLSVIYLLGIVVANITHRMFKGLEEQLRDKALCGLDYDHIRNDLYTSGDAQNLVHEFEFRRSKVRICRGWYLNSLLIIVALLACLGNGRMGLTMTIFWSLTFGLLTIGTYISWLTATETELRWLKSFSDQKTKAQNVKSPLPSFIDN